jgi:hypothetical protein
MKVSASDLKANNYQKQRKAAREEAAKAKSKETYDQALQRYRQ